MEQSDLVCDGVKCGLRRDVTEIKEDMKTILEKVALIPSIKEGQGILFKKTEDLEKEKVGRRDIVIVITILGFGIGLVGFLVKIV